MDTGKTTFALFFGNRGFFPGSLMAQAREELPRVLRQMGHEVIMMETEATRYGAVSTPAEGEKFANFLRANHGKYGGVILSLPNFGDEGAAVVALQDAGVPILVQAYPDDLDKMGPESRRDAFCGKISIMDVFRQIGLNFTALKPHVVSPLSDRFAANVDYFDRLCRVVSGMKRMTVGAIGARTTPFKTVRIDEVALQRHGITVETVDLSAVFARVKALKTSSDSYKAKADALRAYTSWDGVPETAFENIARLGVVLDEIIDEFKLDALGVRCWMEMQQQLGVSPCVLLGELNNRGIPAACEVDLGSAAAMAALRLASAGPSTCLDWNNNYGEDDDKCILFHCGPVPQSLMVNHGCVTDHAILANDVGPGHSYGPCVGRIAPTDFTFASLMTDSGRLHMMLGEGRFTEDPIPDEFFGCAAVAQIERLQDVLLHIGQYGFRHHVTCTPGLVLPPLREALQDYLGYEVSVPQQEC